MKILYAKFPIFIKILLSLLLGFTISFVGFSQGEEENTSEDYKKNFNDFSQGINKKFKDFSDKNDSIFITFLEGVWTEFEMFTIEKGIKTKPEEQPQLMDDNDNYLKICPSKEQNLQEEAEEPKHTQQPATELQVPEVQMAIPSMSINYYGTLIDVPRYDSQFKPLNNPTQQQVTDFYTYLADNELVLYGLSTFDRTGKNLNLNGWGMFQLLKKASQKYFSDRNERTLFTWYALLKLGVDARIGLNDKEVYLFAHTDAGIFNNSFIIFDDKKYYLLNIDDKPINFNRIQTYEGNYPGRLRPMSLKLSSIPLLIDEPFSRSITYKKKEYELLVNYSIIDFYSSYPDCDLEVYFGAALSEEAIASWDLAIGEELKSLNNVEKVNELLAFVQYSFPYQIDESQFGREKYMFAEEAMYYPFTDCEDRSVLLAQLIKHYTGLPLIGLNFPNHVAIAVDVGAEIKGDHIDFNGANYTICDPTYIGASLGVGMEEYMDTEPLIIFTD